MPDFPGSGLHIPSKEWSGDQRELNNYLAIERWARGLSFGAVSGAGFTLASSVSIGSGSNAWLGSSAGWVDSGLTDGGGLTAPSYVVPPEPGFYQINVWLDISATPSGVSGFAYIF